MVAWKCWQALSTEDPCYLFTAYNTNMLFWKLHLSLGNFSFFFSLRPESQATSRDHTGLFLLSFFSFQDASMLCWILWPEGLHLCRVFTWGQWDHLLPLRFTLWSVCLCVSQTNTFWPDREALLFCSCCRTASVVTLQFVGTFTCFIGPRTVEVSGSYSVYRWGQFI